MNMERMNIERYYQIIDEVYKLYQSDVSFNTCLALHPQGIREGWAPDLVDEVSKEEFITKCKTDQEFSERWGQGLKIEERKLSLEERRKMANYESIFISPMTVESWDRRNIPTKLITLEYKREKIEIYE
jgi:hypothetical protein